MTRFDSFQPLMAIAPTPAAARTLQPLCDTAKIRLWTPEDWDNIPNLQVYEGSLASHLAQHWSSTRAIVLGMAMGATVRLIAPLLTNKDKDPAVVVIDGQGKFVVSVCGGHRQGADQLTQGLAALLGGQAVITGASAGHQWPGIDTLGVPFGWKRVGNQWTEVSALIAKSSASSDQQSDGLSSAIAVEQTAGTSLWRSMLPANHPLSQKLGKDVSPGATVWIGYQNPLPHSHPVVLWCPRVLWIGIGCERDTSAALIEQAVQAALSECALNSAAVAGIASLDLKGNETGIVALGQKFQWPFFTFSAEMLATIEVPNPSVSVRQAVQTPSVCEAAALLAARRYGSEHSNQSPTLLVEKRVYRDPELKGAATVAIALAEREWIGKTGQLALIGCGPGRLSQMTPAAQTALSQVDVVIGYGLYVDLVRSRLRPGQIVESSPITQERARAQRAIALAQWGLKVAVISSGDAGIYGMAGLVMEELEAQSWDGGSPSVEIFPGISALQAAAARVGTPLMHDFCAISLSDLLTPWEVIESRLKAAAAADFITALYNPKSKNRQTQLTQAQTIFLTHRPAHTPVAIVRSAYRDDEVRCCSTLDKLHELDVDMLTLVLIGNRSTRLYQDWMITPRGYLGFE
ncbi:MAG: precorrin-3B C(17)-methyltransferase [Cyanobacteria bacterium P01_F01_bin.42]